MYHNSTIDRSRFWVGMIIFCWMFLATLNAQNDEKPVWFDKHDPESGVVSGYGNSPDLTTAVLTALGEMNRQVEINGEVITTEKAEGSRNTSSQNYGGVTVIDTVIIMSYPQGDAEWYQTEVIFHHSSKYFEASQKLTYIGEKNTSSCEIKTVNSTINDVLKALRIAGVDIKKQVVPTDSGYQFYIRLQTGSP